MEKHMSWNNKSLTIFYPPLSIFHYLNRSRCVIIYLTYNLRAFPDWFCQQFAPDISNRDPLDSFIKCKRAETEYINVRRGGKRDCKNKQNQVKLANNQNCVRFSVEMRNQYHKHREALSLQYFWRRFSISFFLSFNSAVSFLFPSRVNFSCSWWFLSVQFFFPPAMIHLLLMFAFFLPIFNAVFFRFFRCLKCDLVLDVREKHWLSRLDFVLLMKIVLFKGFLLRELCGFFSLSSPQGDDLEFF